MSTMQQSSRNRSERLSTSIRPICRACQSTHITMKCAGAALSLMLAVSQPALAGDLLDTILNRTTAARDRAIQARDSANEIRDRVREGVENLTGQVKDMIQERVGDLRDQIDEALEGRDEFINGPGCEECRDNIMDLLLNLQALSNATFQMTSSCFEVPPVDFSEEIALIGGVDCRLLFPICMALSVDTCFLNDLQSGAAALQRLQGVWVMAESTNEFEVEGDEPTEPEVLLDAEMEACEVWLENAEVRSDAGTVAKLGMATEYLGKKLMAKGEKQMEAQVGIHGYAHVSAKSNFRKSAGELLQGLGSNLRSLSNVVITSKVNYCLEVSRQHLIVTNQAQILANQQQILDALSD